MTGPILFAVSVVLATTVLLDALSPDARRARDARRRNGHDEAEWYVPLLVVVLALLVGVASVSVARW